MPQIVNLFPTGRPTPEQQQQVNKLDEAIAAAIQEALDEGMMVALAVGILSAHLQQTVNLITPERA